MGYWAKLYGKWYNETIGLDNTNTDSLEAAVRRHL
jgi:hypothetical protein